MTIAFWLGCNYLIAQPYEIERFETFATESGLSQNAVLSLFCDSKGYLWIGTMDGLNRYDGYEFKIFRAEKDDPYSLNNNRVISIWDDPQGFLWLKTHDGWMHYFNPATERFYNFPGNIEPDEEMAGTIHCFTQIDDREIWLGSRISGAYRLSYVEDSVYSVQQFRSRGPDPLTNKSVSFICKDPAGNVWVGTDQGVNRFKRQEDGRIIPYPEHFLVDHTFTAAASTTSDLWLGTRHHGVIRYRPIADKFITLGLDASYQNQEVILIRITRDERYVIIGTRGNGVWFYDRSTAKTMQYNLPGTSINTVFEDCRGDVWVTTDVFGVTKIGPEQESSKYYMLTPPETHQLIDAERVSFFEDSHGNLWIGTHGGGLAMYDRTSDRFRFYRNDPEDPASISSNFVYGVAEDQSGLIWVGSGQFNGGLSKAVPVNPMFSHFQPRMKFGDYAENVIRALHEDREHNLWMANKAGEIFIFDSGMNLLRSLEELPLEHGTDLAVNVYAMMQDRKGYLWLGSKGGGIAVSSRPLRDFRKDYSDLSFYRYTRKNGRHDGLSSDMVYSIMEDSKGRVWIGTYGGGINLVTERSERELRCVHYDLSNSNLNSQHIRHILQDSRDRIWFATTFGVHLLESEPGQDSAHFRSFIYDPIDPGCISYNDVIHIFEDRDRRLWFGTFGGGLNRMKEGDSGDYSFTTLNFSRGLVNDAVLGILQDSLGYIWISTENGISRIHPDGITIDNFDNSNGLQNNKFNENTCIRVNDGSLIFGNTRGILAISPGEVEKTEDVPTLVLTNLYISGSRVDFKKKGSPLDRHIDYLGELVLDHGQSSFSIEFAALSYLDTRKNEYAYRLEKYDDNWIFPGGERRASYTRVPPGKYTFQVKSAGLTGKWNQEPRSLTITIRPPWWKSTPAKILYLLLILLMVEVSRRVFLNYYRLQNDLKVEKRVNEIKLQFFTNISHEIRTPLTLILGPVEDIRRVKNLPDSVREPLEIIQRNSRRILRLVNQLLDFRKIQNKKMRLSVQEVILGRFLADVCHNFDYLAIQRNINFQYPGGMQDARVWFDPDKIDTVLFNLLSNAFKFTPAGRTIRVEAGVTEDGQILEIAVTDQGSGIPEEKLSLLFQRYTSLATENLSLTGTGIGLAFSNEIIKAHGGEFNVDSKMNKGSRFVFRIPATKEGYSRENLSTEDIVWHSAGHEPYELASLRKESFPDSLVNELRLPEKSNGDHIPIVLLVEDNLDIRQYIRKILVPEFEVVEAENGLEGMKLLDEMTPDLVLTDLMMPEMDGLEMTRNIKNDFSTSHIPVVMLTARSTIDHQIEGIESGAEGYILKPFHAGYLMAVLRNLLQQRKLLNERLINELPFNTPEIRITGRDEQFLDKVIGIIGEHYHETDFGVDRLTELSGVGRTVFYNKIRSLTGMPPVQFLRQMRIKIAAKLLVSNGYNISETAYMTGFSDVKYFRKCFREVFGVTPSAYKTSHSR